MREVTKEVPGVTEKDAFTPLGVQKNLLLITGMKEGGRVLAATMNPVIAWLQV